MSLVERRLRDDQEAVRVATEEAARDGRLYCVIDEWALSRARLLLEMWLAER